MHNLDFGQIHCVDLLKKTHTKFTLYFSCISTNFYLISKFGIISANIYTNNQIWKRKPDEQYQAEVRPTASAFLRSWLVMGDRPK
jgi:hypothetical protein